MKITYLNGPYRRLAYSRSSRSPAVTKSGTMYYPIALAYAAGMAQQETEFEISLLDAVARRWDRKEVLGYLRESPPDLVFCDTSTPSISEDLDTADAIKSTLPQTRVVMVGTHATALPEELLNRNPNIDAVARGEFDITAMELARAMADHRDWHSVAGLTFRQNGQLVHTAERELIENLDTLPFVSRVYRNFLEPKDYFFAAAQYPMIMLMTSRGCPHRCQWCLYPQVMHRGMYRRRTSENVAAEFDYIEHEMPEIREVGIEDDLFTGDKQRMRQFCQRLIRQRNRLKFWCDTRVDLEYEDMRLLKQAGCRSLIVGFESASQEILDRIQKGTQTGQAFEFMENARRANLLVHGCFVLGNPAETRQTMQETLQFAQKLNPDTVQFFPMMVYPGTQMYDWARQNGYLRTTNYNEWLTPEGLHNSVVDLPGLPGEEVVRFCDYARRQFYLRKGYLLRKIVQSLKSVQEARRNLKAFRRFARFLVKAS